MLIVPAARDYVRSEFVTTNPGFLSDTEIDRWLNDGYFRYVGLLMKADQGYFEETVRLNMVARQETIALPSAFSVGRSFFQGVRVERVLPTGTVPLRFRKRFDEVNPISSAVTGFAYLPTYCFRGMNIVLEPPPASAETGGILLMYKAIPPRLESANCRAAAGSDTLFLSDSSDPRAEYYTGAKVYICSGTGAGQIRKITAYTGFVGVGSSNNFKCTVDSAWGTQPDTTSVFSILVHDDFPESFHDMIVLYAVKRALAKERSMGTTRNYDGASLKELEKDFVDMLEKRTEARKFMQPWNPEIG